ncbi:PLP-dependent aminotransferase family protein [Azorhizobium doebereinerae]|uniref:aminotransferase-like domain-containing protein n=1 Tax=Azorhizobium doebereinerae TaxID=281091 RepID=UPI000403FF24|nr:PLP-dependent aminotransferase family protein [Azorhizobium doebereinerae]
MSDADVLSPVRGDYRALADAIAADIASGRLPAGTRLPAQREFAYQHRIAASTASRVYAELTRRGLIAGEVGRGSYVRTGEAPASGALGEPVQAPVDLQLNFPILPGQDAELAQVLSRLMRSGALASAFRPTSAAATREARGITADFLARAGWRPDPAGLVFTANGRQAIAAAFAALAPPGERIAVEALTYPAVKWIAARLGITLVPLPLDVHGLRPDALLKAHRAAPLRGVYLQPQLHNPLGLSMDARRRAEIAAVLKGEELMAVEDVIYGFLAEEEPLAALAPAHTLLVDSLSKRVAPGLTIGLVAGPAAWAERMVAAVRAGAWAATGLPLAAALQIMTDGIAGRLTTAKQADARERQAILREVFDGAMLKTDPRSYHAWLELPDSWRADAFAAAAARRGIAITPASAFCVAPSHAPNAVRLALSPPSHAVLKEALLTLHRLIAAGPMESEVE